MDIKLKNKWLEALKSGKYEKGEGALRIGNKYCCLGVLVEVVEGPDCWEATPASNNLYCTKTGQASYLSDELLEKVGMGRAVQSLLASINDSQDSFEPVIKYIEENL